MDKNIFVILLANNFNEKMKPKKAPRHWMKTITIAIFL